MYIMAVQSKRRQLKRKSLKKRASTKKGSKKSMKKTMKKRGGGLLSSFGILECSNAKSNGAKAACAYAKSKYYDLANNQVKKEEHMTKHDNLLTEDKNAADSEIYKTYKGKVDSAKTKDDANDITMKILNHIQDGEREPSANLMYYR
jgi:hypothetical protein